jgi:outer membrane protein
LSLGVLGLVLAGNTTAKDLMGVYEDALRNDPQLRAADANRLASRESRPQALAALLPQISGTAAYTRDHVGGTQSEPTPAPTGQLYVAEIPFTNGSYEKQWALNLRQNLFSWQNWVTLK